MSGPLSVSVCFLVAQYFIRFEAGFSSKICSHPLIPKCKKLRSSNARIGLAKDVNGTELDLGLASCTSALAFSAALRILSACGASKLTIHSFNKVINLLNMSDSLTNKIWIHLSANIYGPLMAKSDNEAKMPHSERHLSPSSVLQPAHGIHLASARSVCWTLCSCNQPGLASCLLGVLDSLPRDKGTEGRVQLRKTWLARKCNSATGGKNGWRTLVLLLDWWFLKLSFLSFVELEIYNHRECIRFQEEPGCLLPLMTL